MLLEKDILSNTIQIHVKKAKVALDGQYKIQEDFSNTRDYFPFVRTVKQKTLLFDKNTILLAPDGTLFTYEDFKYNIPIECFDKLPGGRLEFKPWARDWLKTVYSESIVDVYNVDEHFISSKMFCPLSGVLTQETTYDIKNGKLSICEYRKTPPYDIFQKSIYDYENARTVIEHYIKGQVVEKEDRPMTDDGKWQMDTMCETKIASTYLMASGHTIQMLAKEFAKSRIR